MKKLFILFALSVAVSTWNDAQAAIAPQSASTPRTEEYCEIRFAAKPFTRNKVIARIDVGNGEDLLKDDAGKNVEFASNVAALNYMNSKGWKLIDIHARLYEGVSHTYYVMKRSLE